MQKNLEIQWFFTKQTNPASLARNVLCISFASEWVFATRPQVTDSLNPRPQVFAVMVIAVGTTSEEVRPTRKYRG